MNERIRELYDQCWFGDDTAVYHKDFSIDTSMGSCFDTEMFAELIVIKCLDIVDKKVSGMVGVAAMKEIEEYFGIEEWL